MTDRAKLAEELERLFNRYASYAGEHDDTADDLADFIGANFDTILAALREPDLRARVEQLEGELRKLAAHPEIRPLMYGSALDAISSAREHRL